MKIDNIIDKKLLKNIDIGIIISVILLFVAGIIAISSATGVAYGGSLRYVKIQSVAFVLGLIAMLITLVIDYNTFGEMSKTIYIVSIILLISVLIFGKEVKGSKSWFDFGVVNFQPSEIVKISFILSFAKVLEKREDTLDTFKGILPVVLYIVPIVGLILLQNDFGTALVFVFFIAFMLFAAGIGYKYVFGAVVLGILSLPLLWFYVFEDYQRKRILVFLNPEMDPLGRGYHVIQSKIAVGSGQFWGKGLYQGTQNNLGFIPERHTDFIFSVIGEEMGLVGSVAIILLFMLLIMRCIYIAKISKDSYGKYICIGVMAMFLFHILENIGMTIGMMPVTGIPLPFVSYGGSSLLTNMIAIGLVLNVGMRRQVIRF
ncbi:rod shape-determining protein RodA [Lutispora thermophila]|uniref:Peptidoglycan glycosyltransferase RodA n=1 Tax=Lutispora thermophila DSM 19022 TaxID=1122184 RepID=A0A1M6BQQ8_9FIRM|nr:rod shape-determining protein RodA [Lutispora thermophila]SHI50888.1 rod shape determining protein RodA [Lutispora thermophila DSM 19022]